MLPSGSLSFCLEFTGALSADGISFRRSERRATALLLKSHCAYALSPLPIHKKLLDFLNGFTNGTLGLWANDAMAAM